MQDLLMHLDQNRCRNSVEQEEDILWAQRRPTVGMNGKDHRKSAVRYSDFGSNSNSGSSVCGDSEVPVSVVTLVTLASCGDSGSSSYGDSGSSVCGNSGYTSQLW